MKIEVKETGKLKKSIIVEVSEDKLGQMRAKIIDQISKEANIPGFRKGKAPKDMIEKKHAQLIKEELLKEAVPHFYQEAVKENDVEPISYPQFKDVEIKDGNLNFTAEFEVKPEILIDESVYTKIKLKLDDLKVEDKDKEDFISRLKDQLAAALDKKVDDIDTAFVAKWSGYKNEDEFLDAIGSEIHLNKVVERRRAIEKQILDVLMEKVDVELPASVVAEQKNRLMNQQRQNLMQRGIPKDDIKKHFEEIEKGAETMAADQVKMYYVLEAVAKKENLKYDQNNILEVVLGTILTKVI